MTDQVTRVVPAGWYQDPALPQQVRWWNGLSWTEHVREKPVAPAASTATTTTTASSSQDVVETTAERIKAVRELERQFGIGTSENEIITSATALGYGASASASFEATANAAQSSTAASSATTESASVVRRSDTGAAWLIALTPGLTLLLCVAAAYTYFYLSAPAIVIAAGVALTYLAGLLWALSDRRTLAHRGIAGPSAAWALLGGLGYLIVRRVRTNGSRPLIMFLVLGALAVVLPLAALGSGQLRPLTSALTIQNTISRDYVDSGEVRAVQCPAFVDTTIGTLFTCTARLPDDTTKQIWVSIDGSAGQFSYALGL